MGCDWREFFAQEEIDTAIDQSKLPKIEKNDHYHILNSQASESDSDPSCDNFEEDQLLARFEQAMDEVIKVSAIQVVSRKKEKDQRIHQLE